MLFLFIVFIVNNFANASQVEPRKPKLILLITVDQLRGDLPQRYRERFKEGGFRYLFQNGVYYSNAHYRHANTETAVGHATIATGADPSVHGIVGNNWVNPKTGAYVYNTEDSRHHIIGKKQTLHEGVSPHKILSTTFGDELRLSTAKRSRVFSVSIKDRGAIIPGGHSGKSFWFSKSSGEFITSTYYYKQYPDWVNRWNQAKHADNYRGKQWTLLNDPLTYDHIHMDDRPYEADAPTLGRVFPHPYGDDKYLYLNLTLTPVGDELTLDFAKTLIEEEKLGQGADVDMLNISFSSTDYVGHLFGPSSLESEDNILRLDRRLADLFSFVDKKVGLDNTLIVLSADHGAPEAPEYMTELGFNAGRFDINYFEQSGTLNGALKKRFGRADLIKFHSHPYLYLDEEVITKNRLEVAEVENFIVAELVKEPGIAYAEAKTELLKKIATGPGLQGKISRNFLASRSGNIHMVQKQYWFFHSTKEAQKMGLEGIAAIHGSPWSYDTFVPIFFAGNGLKGNRIERRVSPADIAPTLSNYVGVKYPSGSTGNPLTEVLSGK